MSTSDMFWPEDPLPVTRVKPMSYDHWKTTEPDPMPLSDQGAGRTESQDRCEQCWREVYGSFPGHVLCREHFMEHQRKAIAAMSRNRGAA